MAALEDLLNNAPKGVGWMNWRLWRELITALIADRARLFGSSGTEWPTARGRFFDIQPGSASTTTDHPFKVTLANVSETETPEWEATVGDGPLLDSPEHTDELTIIGLGSPLPTEDGDVIWIEGDFGTWPDISEIAIKSIGNGDTFEGGVFEHDGGVGDPGEEVYTQTKFRKVIATVVAEGDTLRVERQFVNSALAMEDVVTTLKDSSGETPVTSVARGPYPAG